MTEKEIKKLIKNIELIGYILTYVCKKTGLMENMSEAKKRQLREICNFEVKNI